MACIKGFSYACVPSNQLSYFSTKTYVVVTQKNRRNETVLLARNYRLNLMIKKIFKKNKLKKCVYLGSDTYSMQI